MSAKGFVALSHLTFILNVELAKDDKTILINVAILCALFGMFKWPLQRLSDLQIAYKKVSLNHLEMVAFSCHRKLLNEVSLWIDPNMFLNYRSHLSRQICKTQKVVTRCETSYFLWQSYDISRFWRSVFSSYLKNLSLRDAFLNDLQVTNQLGLKHDFQNLSGKTFWLLPKTWICLVGDFLLAMGFIAILHSHLGPNIF